MSHRNSKPKPHANERTHRRWRFRHDISTPVDESHFRYLQEMKETAREWLEKMRGSPKEEVVCTVGGDRNAKGEDDKS